VLHTSISHNKELPTEAENQSNLDLFYNNLYQIMPRGLSRKSLFNNKVSSLNTRVLCSLPEFHVDFTQIVFATVRTCSYKAWN